MNYTTITPNSIILLITTLALGFLLIPSFLRLRSQEKIIIHLILYLAMGFTLSLTLLLSSLQLPLFGKDIYQQIAGFTQLTTVLIFGSLTLSFLKKTPSTLIKYWSAAVVLLALWSVLAFNVTGIADSLAVLLPTALPITPTMAISAIGWVLALATSLVSVVADLQKRQPAQFLNKLRYWLIAITLFIATGLILFINPNLFFWTGIPLLTVASGLVAYTVLSYHSPDLSLLIGKTLRYLVVTTILFIVLFLSLATTAIVSRRAYYKTEIILWSTALLAILLANILPPLWNIFNRLFTRIIFGKDQQDQKQIIKQYSRTISSVLDMNRLGETIIDLMIETLAIERGVVFVNERSGGGNVSLHPLSSVGIEATDGDFSNDSAFVARLRQGEKVISQYDVDNLPEFRSMSAEEKAWLSELGMEVYAPILRQNEVIGLLAFGSPTQGAQYYAEDLDLMMTLGQQAALAIDSSRLFEQLSVINQEVGLLTNELEGLDQNKSDFLSIASHELRTPLTHIHGYSRMLLDLTEEELSDPQYVKSIIEGVAKGSDRMKNVVDMMFDVTEADVGEINLFLGPVVLEEVIEQAARPFLPALDERRIAFQTDLTGLPTIEADGSRLMQSFENLIGNAIKYTPDGGMVTVEGRATVLDNVGPAVEIVVSDTGIGIDPEYQERIFEKFFRIDDTDHHSTGATKFKGAGPGLGLTLVKGIAEAHGGKAWVESEGHDETNYPGSRFFLVLPLHTVPQAHMPESEIETRHWRRQDMEKAEKEDSKK